MDTNTRFLLKRMDDNFSELRRHVDDKFKHAEQKFENVSQKIDDLQAFKHKVMGMACMAGGVGSLVVNLVMHFLK